MPAINDPNYRYATQTWEADGTQNQYEINFDGGYIRQEDVVAYSVLATPNPDLDDPYDRKVETLSFVSESGETATVQITPTVPTGRRVIIYRSTEKSEPMVDYSDNSMLTADNLDLANKQAIFGIAEIMDGLNAAGTKLDSSVQQIIDINALAQQLYDIVIQLLNSGGIVSVAPRIWAWVGDGTTKDMPIPDADIDDAAFYDVAVAGLAQEPSVDYSIVLGADLSDSVMHFNTAIPDGVIGFTVLRGYARPYTGPTPITTTATTVVNAVTVEGDIIDSTFQNNTLIITSDFPTTVTLRKNDGVSDADWKAGQFFSIMQQGDGQITLVIEDNDGTLYVADGFTAKTRAVNSTISVTCIARDTSEYLISGDLLATASAPEKQSFTFQCYDVASANIAAGTTKYSFRMPYGFVLSEVRATVDTAQAEGNILTFDINKNGTSILSTKLTIDNTEFTSTTAVSQAVISDTVLGDGDLVTVDIDQIGTALAKGLKIQLIGERS